MNATLEQTQAELARLLDLVRRGEEVVITQEGRPVARLTGWPSAKGIPPEEKSRWLAELSEMRQRVGTGTSRPSVEELLEEDRGE